MPSLADRNGRRLALRHSAAAFGWHVLPAAAAAAIFTVATGDDSGAFVAWTWIIVCCSVAAVVGAALRRLLAGEGGWIAPVDWLLRLGSIFVAAIPLLIGVQAGTAWALVAFVLVGAAHWRAAKHLEAAATGHRSRSIEQTV